MRGVVTCLWWILTNGISISSSQCPICYTSAARVTLAERLKCVDPEDQLHFRFMLRGVSPQLPAVTFLS
ncbi:hypothetical protein AOLI_G00070500 [Acnodon oligacanthus]